MTSNEFIKQLMLCILAISFFPLVSQSQNFTVSGTVKQKSSGETLIGASVVVVEKPNVGVTTNEYGFYSLSLPKGNYTLRISYVGYKHELIPVKLESNITVSINLSDEIGLQEVVVSSKKDNDNLT